MRSIITCRALTLRDGRLYARGRPLRSVRRHGDHHNFGGRRGTRPRRVRRDPDAPGPALRHGLHHRDAPLGAVPPDGPLVVNDPAAVRNAPEKLFVLRFRELMPPTLLTLDRDEIRAFWDKHGEIILKPLFGNGGAGVFHLRPGDDNLNSLLEMYAADLPRAGHGAALPPGGAPGRQAHRPDRRRAGGRCAARAGRGRGARQSACRRPRA